MKRLALLTTISQLALIATGGADAADLRLKAPPMVAPPAYSWTGCYVGGHVGYGWGRQEVTENNFSFGPNGAISGTTTLDSSGGLYGVQAGCNYQFAGNWVVGIQGDIAGANINGSVSDPNGAIVDPRTSFSIGMKTDRLGSVTGRLGMTGWNNQALFYVKGGVAWDRNQWNLSQSSNCFFRSACTTPFADDRRTGWTVGGGVEWVISPTWSSWTAFAEYNFYGFGNGPSFVEFDPRNNMTAKQEIQTVKVGLNYKLFP